VGSGRGVGGESPRLEREDRFFFIFYGRLDAVPGSLEGWVEPWTCVCVSGGARAAVDAGSVGHKKQATWPREEAVNGVEL
jgi:uncharacterized protein affecting Mg2+/Co2+ transport